MANATVSRLGQINTSGSDDALFLKTFGLEVLEQFDIMNVMESRTMVKVAQSGKSVQFPRIGEGSAAYQTPGAELVGSTVPHAEIVATFDDLLVADRFIGILDEAMNHYDARAPYVRDIAMKLANESDRHTIIELLLGARLTAVGNELPTGTPINGATTGVTAFRENDKFLQTAEVTSGSGNSTSVEEKIDAIHDALSDAAARLDDNNAPEEGRYALFRPREYRQLAKAVQTSGFSLTNKDFGTNGSVATGDVFQVAGFDIIKTTQLPKTNLAASGLNTFHNGDFTKTVFAVGQNDAVGTGILIGLTMESEYDIRRKGTLYTAHYAKAHKYLRPESLIEFVISTGSVV